LHREATLLVVSDPRQPDEVFPRFGKRHKRPNPKGDDSESNCRPHSPVNILTAQLLTLAHSRSPGVPSATPFSNYACTPQNHVFQHSSTRF
jgi:hypothetical protein